MRIKEGANYIMELGPRETFIEYTIETPLEDFIQLAQYPLECKILLECFIKKKKSKSMTISWYFQRWKT